MQSKEISQSGATMALDSSALGWDPSQYAQHQIQVSDLANAETATLQTRAPSATATEWVDVQQVVGDSAGTNHMIVLSPESGRHAALQITFSNGGGSAKVAFGSHISAVSRFGL